MDFSLLKILMDTLLEARKIKEKILNILVTAKNGNGGNSKLSEINIKT